MLHCTNHWFRAAPNDTIGIIGIAIGQNYTFLISNFQKPSRKQYRRIDKKNGKKVGKHPTFQKWVLQLTCMQTLTRPNVSGLRGKAMRAGAAREGLVYTYMYNIHISSNHQAEPNRSEPSGSEWIRSANGF